MKKIFVFFLFLSQISFAQNGFRSFMLKQKTKKENRWATENVFKTSVFSLNLQTIQQQVFSQNQFSGIGIGYFSSQLVDRPKIQKGHESYIGINPFLRSINSTSSTLQGDLMLGYFYLKKLNEKLSIGGQLNHLLSGRFNGNYDNNSISAETVVEIAPKLHYTKPIRFLRKDFQIDYNLSASILGFGFWTPSYTSNFTLISKGVGVLLPTNYNHFNSRLMLKLPAGKRFSNFSPIIGYGWNTYILKANSSQNIINATHSIYFIGHIQKLK